MDPDQTYNRIVLIGNGFDKALGLATSYSDFMRNFIIERMKESIYQKPAKSKLLSLVFHGGMNEIIRKTIESNIFKSNLNDLLKLLKNDVTKNMRYGFIADLLGHYEDFRWVDIEQIYFKTLINEFDKIKSKNIKSSDYDSISQLNKCMDELTIELQKYIFIQQKNFNTDFSNSSMANFIDNFKDRLVFHSRTLESMHIKETEPEKIILLNFNYTNTLRRFIRKNFDQQKFYHIHIHGEVDNIHNEIIFGYGDDTNEKYNQLELDGNNEVLRKIKSFQYPKTDNYHKILNFLGYGNFEVFVVGHSCGLSDRTLLKTIFEHDHCLAIKTFHHEGEEEDFYKRIEISRHFSDKQKMRERLLPYNKNATIPQTSINT